MIDEQQQPTPDAPQATPPNPPANSSQDPNSETAYATLQKEREARKELEKKAKQLETQLQAFSGIDPGKYKEAMEIAAKQAEWEQQQAELRAQFEADAQAKYEPVLEQQRQQLAAAQQSLLDFQRDTALEQAFYAAEGFSGEFEPAALALRGRVRVSANGLEVLEPDGKTPAYVADKGQSRPKTVAELIDELKGTTSWFARHFKGSDRPGFGVLGSSGQGLPAEATGKDVWAAVTAQRQKQFGGR
jgi:hypothetical protein